MEQESRGRKGLWLKVGASLLLSCAILWWMYRDFDFSLVRRVMREETNWWWMFLSFPFGILAQALRGWRWRLALDPLDEHPRYKVCVWAVFLSYAVSLVVPRIGEFARCGILKKTEGTSFAKALGTVVTERAIDSLIVMAVAAVALLAWLGMFATFFEHTGTSLQGLLSGFSLTGWLVTAICLLSAVGLLWVLLRQLSIYNKVKATLSGIWQGVMSLRHVRHAWLFAAMSVGIWLCYFLHYYLTFFCFEATAHLGIAAALVTFVVGSFAVIVPTPNGAGPWHFAVKTMLLLYGVAEPAALCFVLIVHTVQTMLVALLGAYASIRLSIMK